MGPYPYRSVNTFVNLFLSFCFYSLSTSLSTDEIINISETLRVKLSINVRFNNIDIVS
jgi:hypothetical protein